MNIGDQMEQWQDAAERRMDELSLPNGMMKCPECAGQFDPQADGVFMSPNPFCIPICPACADTTQPTNKGE